MTFPIVVIQQRELEWRERQRKRREKQRRRQNESESECWNNEGLLLHYFNCFDINFLRCNGLQGKLK